MRSSSDEPQISPATGRGVGITAKVHPGGHMPTRSPTGDKYRLAMERPYNESSASISFGDDRGCVMSAHPVAQTPQPFPRPGDTQAPRKPTPPATPAAHVSATRSDTRRRHRARRRHHRRRPLRQRPRLGFQFTRRLSSSRRTMRGAASGTTSTARRLRLPTW